MTDLIKIAGVSIYPLQEIADDRGSVLHMISINSNDFIRFGECYFSEILPGSVKAWKLHYEQTQNLAVPLGRIRLVIYDDRERSSTRGNLLIQELGRPDSYLRVKIPPGLWYGFECIGNKAALIANCADKPHNPTDALRLPASDTRIPYTWVLENT